MRVLGLGAGMLACHASTTPPAASLASPAVQVEADITPGAPTPALLAAYHAAAAGRWDEAAIRFAAVATDEPYHLARAAEVADARGDEAGARRLWAAAWAGFRERDATLRLTPMRPGKLTAAGWQGDRPAALLLEVAFSRNETRLRSPAPSSWRATATTRSSCMPTRATAATSSRPTSPDWRAWRGRPG